MLEEPWAHDVGGMFGQDAPLVLGLLVLTVEEGGEIQVHLPGERNRERIGWKQQWATQNPSKTKAKNEQNQPKMGVGQV